MFFLKWVQLNGHRGKRNEFDEPNRNYTEDDINKLILEAEVKKKRRNLSNCVYKDSKDTPERKKRDRNTDSKEEEAREKGMTGIKFNLHSFTLAEEAKELVFPEETGSDGNTKRAKKRCKFVGESHSVTALLYVKIIFTQKTICLSRSHAHSLTFSFQH